MTAVRLRFVLVVAVALVAACGDRPSPTTASPGVPSSAAPTDGVGPDVAIAEAALEHVLDPDSRDLLVLIDPAETIEATIDVTDPKQIAALATARGLSGMVVSRESMLVVGPRDDVVVFAAVVGASRVVVAEDHRSNRWIPADLPAINIPMAGQPYLLQPFPGDRSGVNIDAEHLAPLLREAARSAVTIDGRPYDRVVLDGTCDPSPVLSCMLRATGTSVASGGGKDTISVVSNADTGGLPKVDSRSLRSVPRRLGRAAEWIARHDDAAAAAIADYDSCCGFTWQLGQPGLITVYWTRECAAAVAPMDRPIADTGDCLDSLSIAVDVGRRTIVSIERKAGP